MKGSYENKELDSISKKAVILIDTLDKVKQLVLKKNNFS